MYLVTIMRVLNWCSTWAVLTLRRSPRMQDFVVQCVIKDYQLRPSTDQLLHHEFLRMLPSEKNVRNQIREHTDRRKKVRRTLRSNLLVPAPRLASPRTLMIVL